MNLIKRLERVFQTYFLLASTAGIIILGFIGSINVFFITANDPLFWGWTGLFITVLATMRFLAFFLAQSPLYRLVEAFVSGLLIQVLITIIIFMN